MPFDIRHESPGYLQALGTVAERIGKRKQSELDRRLQLQEEQLRLQEEAQQAANQRYYAGLKSQQETQKAGFQQAEDMARLNAELQMQRLAKEYALRQKYGDLPGGYRYTPAQVRDFEKKQAAIQQIMASKSLRPEQKVQAVNQIVKGMRGLLPMPTLPNMGDSPIQEALKERVFQNPDGTYWVMNDKRMELMHPNWMVTPDAYAKIYQVVSEMLTTTDEKEGREIKPDAATVENFIANQFFKSYHTYLQLMRQGWPKPESEPKPEPPPPDPRLMAMFPTQMGRGENAFYSILPPNPSFMPSFLQGVPSPSPTATPVPSPSPTMTSTMTPTITPTPIPTMQGGVPTDIRLTDNVSSGVPTDIRLTDNVSAVSPSPESVSTPTPSPKYPPQVSAKLAPYYRPESGLLILPDGSIYVLDSNGKWLQIRKGKGNKE